MIDYFLSIDARLHGSPLQLFFCCAARLVVTVHDLLLARFLGHVVDVSISFSYSRIGAVLRSFCSGSMFMRWIFMMHDLIRSIGHKRLK
jgi:hypothetical protein